SDQKVHHVVQGVRPDIKVMDLLGAIAEDMRDIVEKANLFEKLGLRLLAGVCRGRRRFEILEPPHDAAAANFGRLEHVNAGKLALVADFAQFDIAVVAAADREDLAAAAAAEQTR